MKKQDTTKDSESPKRKAAGEKPAKAVKPGEGRGAAEGNRERLAGVARAIDDAIENIREKLTAEDLKASVSDLVRLIQLRKELIDEGPKQVTVRWVEEWNNSPANDE